MNVRDDFPILAQKVHGRPLIYLDNAATTQLPRQVVTAMEERIYSANANVHRGLHGLSARSTSLMERARERLARFIGAEQPCEVIFTSGFTESANLLARSFCTGVLRPGDRVVATELEHHSNLLPWQQACAEAGAEFCCAPMTESGELELPALDALLNSSVRLLAVTWVSNVTGTVNPLRDIITMAHEKGVPVFVDAAQAVRHFRLDVKELGCDFLAFSGHKLLGPTGTGVLYGKKELLDALPPAYFGGGMVDEVSTSRASFGPLPFKFEAGTPNFVGITGLAAAVDYLSAVGLEEIYARERALLRQTEDVLAACPAVRTVASPRERAGAVSFTLDALPPADTALLLDSLGVAVRSGHHCAQPVLRRLGLKSAVRVSPAFYNTPEEIEYFGRALKKITRSTLGRVTP